MHIGFEANTLLSPSPTGIAKYGQQIVRHLSHQDDITLYFKRNRYKKSGKDNLLPHLNYSLYPAWPWNRQKCDILHAIDNRFPQIPAKKRFLTIYDLLLFLTEDEFIAPKKFRQRIIKKLSQSIQSSDYFICISEHTKNDLMNIFSISPERIFVTHLGIDPEFYQQAAKVDVRTKFKLEKPYFFFIGSVSGRKNTHRLVEAFYKSGKHQEMDLVLAGDLSYQHESTLEKIKEYGLEESVIILSYVSDDALVNLYQNAAAFVFPTLYEGFGIPLLEAMYFELPILSSTTGSAPEVARDYAKLVDPLNVEQIAEGMNSILTVDKNKLLEAKQYASQLTWKACAEKTRLAFEQALQM